MRIDYENLRTPDHWQWDKIGNRIKLNYGKSQAAVRSIDGNIPVYGTGGLMEYADHFLCEGNSVLLGRKGTLDNPLYLDHPFWPVDTTFYTTDFNGSVKWFYYVTQTLGLSLLSEATGVPSLSRETFYRIEIPFPPVEEQAAIAAILTTVDRAIAQTEALIAKQRRIKAGLLHDLLTHGIDDAGRLRDPATHRFKETAVGLVPVEWEVVRLSDVCEFASGGTPSRTVASYWNGSIPWVKTAEVDYCLITETEEYISDFGLQNSSAKVFPKGTLLMAIYGEGVTRGKVALLGIDAATNQACLAIFPKPGLNSRFLFYWFTNAYAELRELSHDGSQKNLSAALIGDTFVPIPITVEQENIVTTIRAFEASLAREQTQLAKLNRLKAGLMQDLLTGRVAVSRPVNTDNK
jgi:type I restriction enzyme S subunit